MKDKAILWALLLIWCMAFFIAKCSPEPVKTVGQGEPPWEYNVDEDQR